MTIYAVVMAYESPFAYFARREDAEAYIASDSFYEDCSVEEIDVR